MITPPKFTLDKIKFATDRPTFEKAVELYENIINGLSGNYAHILVQEYMSMN